jgi:fucose permease
MWLSVALFFVYTGIEATAGAWAYSLLTEARGVARMTAGTWVSFYWGALTVGRIGAALFAHRSSAQRLLRGCIGGQAVGALLLWAKVAALSNFLGLVLIGLASAPIFPTLIATTPTRIGETHTANGVGVQIAAAVLGQSLLPALVGVLAQRCGLEVVAPALFGAALCLYGWHELLLRLSRPKTSQPYNAETETPASPPSLR